MAKKDLMPPARSKEDPRYIKMVAARDESNARRKAAKERRKEYQETLSQIRTNELEKAKANIENGTVQTPLEIVQSMIQQSMLAINEGGLPDAEMHKEKELLVKLNKQYMDLLASVPNANLDSIEDEEELSPEELEAQFKLRTKKLREVE